MRAIGAAKNLEGLAKKYRELLAFGFARIVERARRKKASSRVESRAVKCLSEEFDLQLATRRLKGTLKKDRGPKLNRNKAMLEKLNSDLLGKRKQDIKRDMRISSFALNHQAEITRFVRFARKLLVVRGVKALRGQVAKFQARDRFVQALMRLAQERLKQHLSAVSEPRSTVKRSCLRSSVHSSLRKSKVRFAEDAASPSTVLSTDRKAPGGHRQQPSIHMSTVVKPRFQEKPAEDQSRAKRYVAGMMILKCWKRWRFRKFLAGQCSRNAEEKSFVELNANFAVAQSKGEAAKDDKCSLL